MESLQGKLLLASSRLVDPNFARSVVLMVRHGDEGALGLVLNRPLEMTVRQACESAEMQPPCEVEGYLHQGGPCPGPLMAVYAGNDGDEASVIDGICFTTDRERLESLLADPEAAARYFVGYAGWSAGQLEGELETGSWLTLPATPEHLLGTRPPEWPYLMAEATTGQRINPSVIPEDPSLN